MAIWFSQLFRLSSLGRFLSQSPHDDVGFNVLGCRVDNMSPVLMFDFISAGSRVWVR